MNSSPLPVRTRTLLSRSSLISASALGKWVVELAGEHDGTVVCVEADGEYSALGSSERQVGVGVEVGGSSHVKVL